MNKFFLIFLLIILYLILTNFGAGFITQQVQTSNQTQGGGTMLTIGIQDSVSISVTRPRFYGTIEEANGNSILYLAKIIPLPLKKEGFSFMYFHIPFLVLLLIILMKGGQKDNEEKREIYPVVRDSNGFLVRDSQF